MAASASAEPIVPQKQRLYIVRHGDRWDYAHPEWRRLSDCPDDPPLTELGHRQAQNVAAFLADGPCRIHRILCSPYLRTIQTADRIAESLGLGLHLEPGIWESKHCIELPSWRERFRYFPRIQLNYEPKYTPQPEHSFDELFLRVGIVARLIESSFPFSENLVLVTHAAPAIALCTAFLVRDRPISEADTHRVRAIGPCGVFALERDAPAAEWTLVLDAHHDHLVAGMSSTTTPWHFLSSKY